MQKKVYQSIWEWLVDKLILSAGVFFYLPASTNEENNWKAILSVPLRCRRRRRCRLRAARVDSAAVRAATWTRQWTARPSCPSPAYGTACPAAESRPRRLHTHITYTQPTHTHTQIYGSAHCQCLVKPHPTRASLVIRETLILNWTVYFVSKNVGGCSITCYLSFQKSF